MAPEDAMEYLPGLCLGECTTPPHTTLLHTTPHHTTPHHPTHTHVHMYTPPKSSILYTILFDLTLWYGKQYGKQFAQPRQFEKQPNSLANRNLFGKLFGKQKLFGKLFGTPVKKCLLLANYLDCLPNRNCLANCLAHPLKSVCFLQTI